jgi:hypothetical protein
MELVDFYPQKGAYFPGEPVVLSAEIQADAPSKATLLLHCYDLDERVAALTIPLQLQPGSQHVALHWQPPSAGCRAYGLEAALLDARGQLSGRAFSACDVLEH